jgi:hypothetical protein
MKKILRISFVIILLLMNHSCKKWSTHASEPDIEKYIIEMNKENRISRVTYSDPNNVLIFDILYNYSENKVEVIDFNNGFILRTYFLNNSGLADSCTEGTNMVQYHYNNDNYLISLKSSGNTFGFGYQNGNRISSNFGTHNTYYQYNSLVNLIDIDTFQGPYLGKLNRNLLQSKQVNFTMASDGYTTDYQYKLNSGGLVIQRIGTTTYNRIGSTPTILISNFEYIITE